MRISRLIGVFCAAGALSACATDTTPGRSINFVGSNPDSVMLDFAARPPGELAYANDSANQQCHLFNRGEARLESLNVRDEGVIRGTYRCAR